MTKRLLLSCVISCVLWAGCQKEATTLIAPRVKPSPALKEQILPLRVSGLNELTLRAETTEADPLKTIYSVSFLFFSGADGSETLAHIKTETITEASQLERINLRLPKGSYKLVALANLPEALRQTLNPGVSLSSVLADKQLPTFAFATLTEGKVQSILMGNEQGALSIGQNAFVDAISQINSRTEVRLEPSLARVLVWGSPSVSHGRLGTASPRYAISCIPLNSRILRPLAKLKGGTPETAGDGSNRADRYAGSTLLDAENQGTSKWQSLVGHLKPEHYLADSKFWVRIPQSLSGYAGHYGERGMYAKEATLPEGAFLQGLTPCVVLSLPYIPQGLTLSEGEGWINYQGRYIGEQAFRRGMSEGFPEDATLREAVRGAGIVEADFQSGFNKGGFRFYHQSTNYYVSYIKHFEVEAGGSKYGKYGLVRGNEYRLELKYVSGAGMPTPPALKSNTDPIEETSSLGASITVVPLVERAQNIEL